MAVKNFNFISTKKVYRNIIEGDGGGTRLEVSNNRALKSFSTYNFSRISNRLL